MARIISIVNQKGGTGKSACTANLAVGLAQKNMKVLIVDADPQSDVSAGFGYRDCDDSNETLTALMDSVMKDEDIPSDCYIRHQAEGITYYLFVTLDWQVRQSTVGKCNEQGICIETDFIWYQGSI